MNLSLRDWRAIIATLLLPVLAAALTIWSTSGRTDRFDQIPAAIVNLDKGVEMELNGTKQMVPLGRQLASGLMYPKEDVRTNLNWHLVKEENARTGLAEGKYQAVITIPEKFSENLVTIGTTDAKAALITVTSNDASSEIMGMISQQIADAAAHSMGSEFTERMLDQIYLGFNEMKDQLGQAADGAAQLDDGAKRLGQGSSALSSGAWQLSSGLTELSSGLGEASDGAQALAGGAGELNSGVGQLQAGANRLAGGLAQLGQGVAGTKQQPGLVGGVSAIDAGVNGPGGLAEGTKALAEGSAQLGEGVGTLTTSLQKVTKVLMELEQLLPEDYLEQIPSTAQIQADLERLEAALADSNGLLLALRGQLEGDANNVGLLPQLQAALTECEALATGPEDCQQLRAAIATVESVIAQWPTSNPEIDQVLARLNQALSDLGVEQLKDDLLRISRQIEEFTDRLQAAGGIKGIDAKLTELRDGANQLAAGAQELNLGVNGKPDSPGLAQGISQLKDGINTVNTALNGDGTNPSLVGGSRQLASGINQLMAGTQALSSGADELAGGISQAADGAGQLTEGGSTLAQGASALDAGVMELIKGTTRFASELEDGAQQVPSYTDAERTRIVKMGAIPVRAQDDRINQATALANVVFPWAAAIVLWIGAFGAYLVMPGLRRRLLASTHTSWQVAWRSLWPALAIGALQALGVIVVATAMGVKPVNLIATTFLVALGVAVFAAVNQAMLAVAGARLGRLLALLFLVIQVVSLGGVIPIETAPEAFHAIEGVVPLSILSSGLSHTVLGGEIISLTSVIFRLLLWGVSSVILTVIAASKARQMSGTKILESVNKAQALT
ncbi:MAG: YhgE/Pip domain-containing protein [Actinomycetaceae bacterium]|nr:YhgE/Pip domain-containing protein [Actinomycetaceae bacterium]